MERDHPDRLIIERLGGLAEIRSRAMFGGDGHYWRGTIFGILTGGRLYLKVDDRSKGDFLSRGMGPFRPTERQTLKSYYEVPADVLEDTEALEAWAREAIRAAQAKP
jgi:DNA transformation protein